jgi:putative membrane protein
MRLILRVLVTAVALWVATLLVDGVTVEGGSTLERFGWLIVVALIFGIVNLLVKPLVMLLSIPLLILTLGLIMLVINALMLWLTGWISDQLGLPFQVDGFWAAFWGGLVVTIVSFVINVLIPDGKGRRREWSDR